MEPFEPPLLCIGYRLLLRFCIAKNVTYYEPQIMVHSRDDEGVEATHELNSP